MYRYSDRLTALAAAENAFSGLVARRRVAGQPLLDLTVSNPTDASLNYPHNEIADALGTILNFRYQPDPFGNLAARESIIRHFSIPVLPEHLALTASTSEAYALLFKLLANPGDEILVPTPSYPLFDYLAALEAVNLRPYRLDYDGAWFIDFASLEAAISERTRAIILVNPNNPTGSFLRPGEFDRLCAFGLPLISDEVFKDYAFDQSSGRVSTLNARHQVLNFTLNGLSKAAGMPQMKLGWIVINGPVDERKKACAKLELILDTYLSVGAPVQLAAEHLLQIGNGIQRQIRQRLQTNLTVLEELLASAPVHKLRTEGGWSAILRAPQVLTEEEWITRLLTDQGVIVQPGYFFDLQLGTCLVVSLLTPENTFREGVGRVVQLAS